MQIGFFTDGYYPQITGVATSVEGLMKSLEKRGHSVYIISPKYPSYSDRRRKNIRLSSIKVVDDPEVRLATFMPEKKLMKAAKIDFDLIHGFAGGPVTSLGLAIAKIKQVPFVLTYNTRFNEYTHYFWKGRIIRSGFVEKAARIFANRCDYIIAPTSQIKRELEHFGVCKPIVVVSNGVDVQAFKNNKKGLLRKSFAIPRKDKILLYVGRLGKEKSVDFLMRSFAKIHKKCPNTAFCIVGDGPERKKLEALAIKLKIKERVFFTGFVASRNIPQVFKDADVFVFASQTETQGMVIFESLAAGVPPVVVRDDVFTGVIEDTKNGLLSEKNINVFSEKVELLLTNAALRRKMSQQAIKTAEKFSLEASAQKFEALYKHILIDYKANQYRENMFKKVNNITFVQIKKTIQMIDRYLSV